MKFLSLLVTASLAFAAPVQEPEAHRQLQARQGTFARTQVQCGAGGKGRCSDFLAGGKCLLPNNQFEVQPVCKGIG